MTWYALALGLGPPQILRSAQNHTGIQGAREVDSRLRGDDEMEGACNLFT